MDEEPEEYFCNFCGTTFGHQTSLKRHLEEHFVEDEIEMTEESLEHDMNTFVDIKHVEDSLQQEVDVEDPLLLRK